MHSGPGECKARVESTEQNSGRDSSQQAQLTVGPIAGGVRPMRFDPLDSEEKWKIEVCRRGREAGNVSLRGDTVRPLL